jgi:hypothetical protein
MLREGSPLSLGGTGDLRTTERQQMSLCEAACLRRETLRRSCLILCYTRSVASTVPRSAKTYPAMPALECGIRLIVLYGRGRITKGELFDEITELHKLVEMGRLHKIGICPHRQCPALIRRIGGTGHDHDADV